MNFTKKNLVVLVAAALTALTVPGSASEVKGFDFKYDQEGDGGSCPFRSSMTAIAPIFQWSGSTPLPVIRAGSKMLVPEFKQTLRGGQWRFPSFALSGKNGSKGIVKYAGSARASGGSAYPRRNPGLSRTCSRFHPSPLSLRQAQRKMTIRGFCLSQIKSLLVNRITPR